MSKRLILANYPNNLENCTVQDDDYTAKHLDFVWCDTSDAEWTLTLPESPNDFDWVKIIDYTGSFDDNNLTVARNGSTIMGKDEDLTVDTENENFMLIAYAGDWRIYG